MIFSFNVISLCISPPKINGIQIEVEVKDHKLIEDSVKVKIVEVDLSKYKPPSTEYAPFIAFRGFIHSKKDNKTHQTIWGLIPYNGQGRYKAVLITEDGYSPQPGDTLTYYISLRSREVKWSSSLITGSLVLR